MKTTTARSYLTLAIAIAGLGLTGVTQVYAQNIGQVDFTAMFNGDQNLGPTVNILNGAVTISARSMIDNNQPFVLGAPGSAGTIYYDDEDSPFKGGLGVQTSEPKGSKGISGAGGHANEELLFTYNQGGAQFNSLSLLLNDLDYGTGVNKDDDPFLWVNTNNGIFGFNEASLMAASTQNSGDSYTINFNALPGAPQNSTVNSFTVRETNGHIYVKGFNAGVIPEPGTAVLAMVGAFVLIFRTRRRGMLSLSA